MNYYYLSIWLIVIIIKYLVKKKHTLTLSLLFPNFSSFICVKVCQAYVCVLNRSMSVKYIYISS